MDSIAECAATTLRRSSSQSTSFAVGAGALAGGFALTSLGVYRLLESGTPKRLPHRSPRSTGQTPAWFTTGRSGTDSIEPEEVAAGAGASAY